MAVDDQVDRALGVVQQLAAEADERGGSEGPWVGGEAQQPCAVTAGIMFRLCRAPVAFTIGVRRPAQVVPAW